jgi:hypothetical protein
VPVDKLDKAFDAIATERTRTLGRVKFQLVRRGAQYRVKDHVFMHGSKLSPLVRERLDVHGLMLPKGIAETHKKGDWWLVNERASDLVLSCIADRLAARQGWTSITDSKGCHAFNDLDWKEASAGTRQAEDQLARMVVTDLVPDVIDRLPIEKYVELRHRYEPIRALLAPFVNEVLVEKRLSRIGDAAELRREVDHCVKDLKKEIENFRKSAFGRTLRRWGPFSLGAFVTVASGVFGQAWALPLAGASVLFAAVDKAGLFEQKATKRGEFVRLVAAARKDIVSSVDLTRF